MNNKLIKKTESSRIIARLEKGKEVLLEQLLKTPIVQIACEKTGIARSTYYRWLDDDDEFNNKIKEAIRKGKSLINDMAESKLISAIQNGNTTAIIYWLKNNHKGYVERKPIFQDDIIEPVQMMITTYDPKYYDEDRKVVSNHEDEASKATTNQKCLNQSNQIKIETYKDEEEDDDDEEEEEENDDDYDD
jgi:hypothetical protein